MIVCLEEREDCNDKVEWVVPSPLKLPDDHVLTIVGKRAKDITDRDFPEKCFENQKVDEELGTHSESSGRVKPECADRLRAAKRKNKTEYLWEYRVTIHHEDYPGYVCAEVDPGVIIRD